MLSPERLVFPQRALVEESCSPLDDAKMKSRNAERLLITGFLIWVVAGVVATWLASQPGVDVGIIGIF